MDERRRKVECRLHKDGDLGKEGGERTEKVGLVYIGQKVKE